MNEVETTLFGRNDWWDQTGAFRLLHDINPLRVQWIESACGGLSGKRLLDLGCGGGIFAEAVAKKGAKVSGVDKSAAAILVATQHAAEQQLTIDYRQQDGINSEEAGKYEIVTCLEMLEHTDNVAAVVADVATLLAPGGSAVFSTINRTLCAWMMMLGGLEVALKILPVGTHDYRRFVKPTELAAMCEDCGLSVANITGLQYSFFGRVYLLDERHTAVNYFLVAKRLPHKQQ